MIWYSLLVKLSLTSQTETLFGIKIYDEVSGRNNRLGVSLGATDNGMNAGNKLVLVKRLGDIIVRARTEPFDLISDARESGKDQDGRPNICGAQFAQHFKARHVRQVQIEQDDVVS